MAFFYHFILLAVGISFLKVTYSISANDDEGKLEVLSYNVRVFNNYTHLRNEDYVSSKKMIEWSLENSADIKCFQEYYNNDKSEIFNVREKLKDKGWKYAHEHIVLRDQAKAEFGIVIFSKYPVVAKGILRNDKGRYLHSIYADVKVKDDTVRVYNTHLQSMSIDEENVVNTDRLAESYKDTGYRLKSGFVTRAIQVDALKESIDKCKYPVIVCGDFNELPYSYTYFKLRRGLDNAFEKAGNGFGFTYNGKLFFLRIDNQFYSNSLNIHNFFTYRNADFSDHFPVTASYSW